jgi:hypothetical protein
VAFFLLLADYFWQFNEHNEFTFIIKMQALMHLAMLFLRHVSTKFDQNKLTTWRITFNFVASVSQLTVIIISIGLYINSFGPKKNKDGTIAAPPCLPLGVWHMVNIYQFWVFLEIISFFTNFAGVILTLFMSSCWHLKVMRVLKIPVQN